MGTRRPTLSIALLAVLSAAEATAASHRVAVKAGEAQLPLSPGATSALTIKAQALAEAHCSIGDQSNSIVCHLVTRPDGGCTSKAHSLSSSPSAHPQWRVTGMDLAADSVVTSCGTWNVSLKLDTPGPQPTSPALPSLLQARLHLANPALGKVADDLLVLGAFDDDDPDDPTEPDCLPDWVADCPDLLKEYEALGCMLCDDTKRSHSPFQ